MGHCKDNFNVMDEIRKLICEMDDRKPEPECCNIPCPPLGCPKGPCPGMCMVQGNPDPCCVSRMPQCPSSCPPPSQQCSPNKNHQEINFVSPCCPPKKYCLPPVPFPPLKKYKQNCRLPPCCPPAACQPGCPPYIQICYPPICPPPRQAPCLQSCAPSCPPPTCCPQPPQKKLIYCATPPPFLAGQPSTPSLPCPRPKNNNCCQTFIVSIPPR